MPGQGWIIYLSFDKVKGKPGFLSEMQIHEEVVCRIYSGQHWGTED